MHRSESFLVPNERDDYLGQNGRVALIREKVVPITWVLYIDGKISDVFTNLLDGLSYAPIRFNDYEDGRYEDWLKGRSRQKDTMFYDNNSWSPVPR